MFQLCNERCILQPCVADLNIRTTSFVNGKAHEIPSSVCNAHVTGCNGNWIMNGFVKPYDIGTHELCVTLPFC